MLDVFKHHPDFAKDEPTYSQTDQVNTSDKHIMWCHTLILLRECAFGESDAIKQVWEFVTIYKRRLYSVLMGLDQCPKLANFVQATGIQFDEITQ
jgi:lysyl-tRNA synthetase class I